MIKDKEVKSFFEFLISNKAQTVFTSDLSKYVADAKHNTQWRLQYMTVERLERLAFKNGLKQGAQQNTIENARKLLADGKYTAEEISELLQIPVEAFVETVAIK